MDSREPPHSPHPLPHQLELENIPLIGPDPFTNTFSTTTMEPTTAQFPLSNIIFNSSARYEPLSLKPYVGASSSGSGSFKRKRGRPRKYFLDAPSSSMGKKNTGGRGRGRPRKYFLDAPSSSTGKKNTSGRGRGRPRGSFKKKQLIEIPGVTNGSGFSPHVILVNHGEDIIAKVGAFCQGGPNTDMLILSAHGLVSSVSLYQPGTIVTYEGRFEIISLSGNLEVSDNTTNFKKMSYFKVSLESPSSRPLVGVVDKLIAASLVKVTIGSFTLDCKNASSNNLKSGHSSVLSPQIVSSGTPTSDAYQGPSSDSSGDNDNIPLNQFPGVYKNVSQSIPSMSMHQELWARQTHQ